MRVQRKFLRVEIHTRFCAGLIFAVILASSGCALRSADAEHYFGPVLFRHSEGADGGAVVVQVRSLGFLGELGWQWAITLGVADRVTVAGRVAQEPMPARWSSSGLGHLAPGRWYLSPFYLRGDGIAPSHFIYRRLYGAQIGTGDEWAAASIGVIARAEMRAPHDAVAIVRFSSADPLAARFTIWTADRPLPAAEIIEEAQR